MKKKLILSNTKKNRSLAKKERAKMHPRKVIILMSMPTIIHTVTAVLDMPEDFNGRVERATDILSGCTGNTYVTVPAGVITAMNTKLTNYSTALTPAMRDAAWPPLHNGLKSLMSLFQTAASDDIINAVVIIESGNFRVKQIGIPQKHEFTASNGLVSGSIYLTAEGGPQGSMHNWNYSHDGITWVRLRGTSMAHTHIDGLAQGDDAYFTHELSLHDVPQELSQVIHIIVK